MNIKTVIALVGTLALGAPMALAQMQGMDMQGMDIQKMMQMMMPQPGDTAPTRDFKQAHMDMMKDMPMQFTGDADKDFATSMMKHHAGGIEMAKIQLKHGKDPEMRKMAEKLIKEQGNDNKEFATWLKKNN
jgi:uncharacterized protein (DUF305 family)